MSIEADVWLYNGTLHIGHEQGALTSTDFAANFGSVLGTSLNDTQLALLRAQIKTAHGKGIALRYWDQPGWPISTRNGIWRQLFTEGVDLINADDVLSAAGFAGDSEGW